MRPTGCSVTDVAAVSVSSLDFIYDLKVSPNPGIDHLPIEVLIEEDNPVTVTGGGEYSCTAF
ncbi:hypothetical protein J6590_106419 [Homalodisca vitripennis]|nr:hypothetical protein J6590_106419 [Homalodisca vitripennis]